MAGNRSASAPGMSRPVRPYPTAFEALRSLDRVPEGVDTSDKARSFERLSGIGWARIRPRPELSNHERLALLELDTVPPPVVPLCSNGRMLRTWEVLTTIATQMPSSESSTVEQLQALGRTAACPF
eukprot:CAMPEP_0204273394 /NCGR_PEP_ID=MMETSP0468-20130131/23243_1 /ASSEMBLY_ACC=CAM_ASM_000383 /TAXON_ID=2969 /ORGANISM="Oxyrrhis marina" /LENGTH=125 /DNA_ID=CAMNT_0051249403 /DNA_START=27 /DNA_END=404 /DNA_ORIENTATION=+